MKAILLLTAAFILAMNATAYGASLTIKGGRESGEQAIETFMREDRERARQREDERAAKRLSANALGMDCRQAGDLYGYCDTGECHHISNEIARDICIGGPSALLRSDRKQYEFMYSFIEQGHEADKFGVNKYPAGRLAYTNASRQARLEFVIYHLSGMKIYISQ